jgi:hypothetical protein
MIDICDGATVLFPSTFIDASSFIITSSLRANPNILYNFCRDSGSTKSNIVKGMADMEVVGFTT